MEIKDDQKGKWCPEWGAWIESKYWKNEEKEEEKKEKEEKDEEPFGNGYGFFWVRVHLVKL